MTAPPLPSRPPPSLTQCPGITHLLHSKGQLLTLCNHVRLARPREGQLLEQVFPKEVALRELDAREIGWGVSLSAPSGAADAELTTATPLPPHPYLLYCLVFLGHWI